MKRTKSPLSKFTDEELYAELNRRNADKDLLSTKAVNIGGFTVKDVVCVQGSRIDYDEAILGHEDKYGPYYSFYLRVDGKLYDIYYQCCMTGPFDARLGVNPPRWPEAADEGDIDALALVPNKFAEASENTYEYHGKEPVEKYLKKAGIEFRIWNPDLDNSETGEDKNYA
jgi:hypothetical protein